MLVGEIGIPRHEFLYELRLWEIILITRGYFKRYHPAWEQARLIAYNAAHCMGSKNAPVITQWLKFPWETSHDTELSDEEVNEMREMIRKENEKIK
jgi:hypothetical protein